MKKILITISIIVITSLIGAYIFNSLNPTTVVVQTGNLPSGGIEE